MPWLVVEGYGLFFFIMWKKMYATTHFTGAWKKIQNIIAVFAGLDIIFALYYAIRCSISHGWYTGPVLIGVGLMETLILNKIVDGIVWLINKKDIDEMKQEEDPSKEYVIHLWRCVLDRQQDVASTVIAVFGCIINPVLAVLLHFAL